nr:MAG TPA: Large Terminase [Caudoviricetes sp.]
MVVSGKILKGQTEIDCCKRHLEDLKRKDFDYIFDVKAAEKAIDIANELTILEGVEPKKLKTRGFQNFIIGSLHGWRRKRSSKLRFREAYVQIGRQNGKSFLSGTEINNRATFSGYQKGRIYCAATKQDQANIVWDEVEKFILADKDLSDLYHIRHHERTITSKVTGTVVKSVGRDTKSADGFRSILAVIDEYHAHPNNQMYKLMLDGQIGVDSPLTLAITTAGFNLNSPCYGQYEFCKRVLSGLVDKESLFIFITEMDKEDDIWDYKNWAKANPLLLWNEDNSYNMDKVKDLSEKAIEAKEKGGQDLVNFMTKSLNVWVKYSGDSYVNLEKFKACESDLTLEDFKVRDCILGIDLSSGGDLTSIALVFRDGDHYYIYSHSFMPILRLEEHERTDEAPYRIWAREGLLTLTEGVFGLKTDYKYIVQHIKDLIAKYDLNITACGYDGHNANAFLADLEFLNCDLVEITQSAKSLNDATVDLRLSIEALQVKYDRKNALLKWSFANAKTTQNSFGEIKVMKETATERIDVVDAVIDAWKLAMANSNAEKYDAEADTDEWLEILRG